MGLAFRAVEKLTACLLFTVLFVRAVIPSCLPESILVFTDDIHCALVRSFGFEHLRWMKQSCVMV